MSMVFNSDSESDRTAEIMTKRNELRAEVAKLRHSFDKLATDRDRVIDERDAAINKAEKAWNALAHARHACDAGNRKERRDAVVAIDEAMAHVRWDSREKKYVPIEPTGADAPKGGEG